MKFKWVRCVYLDLTDHSLGYLWKLSERVRLMKNMQISIYMHSEPYPLTNSSKSGQNKDLKMFVVWGAQSDIDRRQSQCKFVHSHAFRALSSAKPLVPKLNESSENWNLQFSSLISQIYDFQDKIMRGAILLTLVVVLGLVCVCCKGTDVKKSPEGSLLLDIDPKVANAPGDDKKKPGPENDPHGWRWRFRYRKGYRRRRYPSRRPYPPHHTHPPPPPTPATSVPCSSSRPDGVQWANEWTKSLDFECPKGKAFTYAH